METQKPVEWEDVKPNNENVWSYNNPEEFIDGVLIAKKSNIGPNNSNTYHLENKEGIFMVWGTTILDDRMLAIKIGERVKIIYKGTEKNQKGQDTKLFQVQRTKDKVKDINWGL